MKWMETAEDDSFINVIAKYKSKRGANAARLEIVALDPSKTTGPIFSEVYSNIVMSGTLQPLEAYIQITKLPENTAKKVVPSPFPKEHVLPLVCCDVTTAMEKRTAQMYRTIINHTEEVVQNTNGNSGVFAASYQGLEGLRTSRMNEELQKPLFCERRGMSSKENERMVDEFKACAQRGGAVLLGVQGGRSSEGVDFPGDEMNSVVIVGMPYAEPTPKVKAQISYFEGHYPGLGREYGYVIPAMKKASQAAGRPIRTLEDKAAMVFLDDRFSAPHCRRFFPSWIRENLNSAKRRRSNITGASAFFQKSFLNDAKSIWFSSSIVGISFMFLSSLTFPKASTQMSLETGVDIFTLFLR
jgi:DNA excision repair protein ERCC-2